MPYYDYYALTRPYSPLLAPTTPSTTPTIVRYCARSFLVPIGKFNVDTIKKALTISMGSPRPHETNSPPEVSIGPFHHVISVIFAAALWKRSRPCLSSMSCVIILYLYFSTYNAHFRVGCVGVH